jgi:hypothetical protein
MSVASSRLVPWIKVCYANPSGLANCTMAPFNAGNTRILGGNFSLTYIGSFQTSFNFFGQKVLIDESKSTAYFVEAAVKNVPIAGYPGEIQANNKSAFYNATPTSFIFANDICTRYLSDSAAHFECVPPPLGGITSQTPLPRALDGIFWSYSTDDSLIGDVLNPPGLSLSMMGTGALKFKTARVQVCPVMEFLDVSGVWGSPVGAKVILKAHSTCLPGKCILSSYSTKITLDSVFLELAGDEVEYEVFFRSNTKEVNFELFCSSLGQSQSIVVIGELDDPTPIVPIGPPENPSGIVEWFDSLSLPNKIGFGIGISLAGILVIALLLILLWKMPDIVEYVHNWRMTRQGYNNSEFEDFNATSDIPLESTPSSPAYSVSELRQRGIHIPVHNAGGVRLESVF